MYLWKTQELFIDLGERKMSQWEMTQYLIATNVLWYFPVGVCFDSIVSGEIDWVFEMVTMILTGIGIFYCFTVNRRLDNEDFVVRFVVLSWPVTLRWILISTMLSLILAFAFSGYVEQLLDSDSLLNVYIIVLEIIYFWMMSNYIKLTALRTK